MFSRYLEAGEIKAEKEGGIRREENEAKKETTKRKEEVSWLNLYQNLSATFCRLARIQTDLVKILFFLFLFIYFFSHFLFQAIAKSYFYLSHTISTHALSSLPRLSSASFLSFNLLPSPPPTPTSTPSLPPPSSFSPTTPLSPQEISQRDVLFASGNAFFHEFFLITSLETSSKRCESRDIRDSPYTSAQDFRNSRERELRDSRDTWEKGNLVLWPKKEKSRRKTKKVVKLLVSAAQCFTGYFLYFSLGRWKGVQIRPRPSFPQISSLFFSSFPFFSLTNTTPDALLLSCDEVSISALLNLSLLLDHLFPHAEAEIYDMIGAYNNDNDNSDNTDGPTIPPFETSVTNFYLKYLYFYLFFCQVFCHSPPPFFRFSLPNTMGEKGGREKFEKALHHAVHLKRILKDFLPLPSEVLLSVDISKKKERERRKSVVGKKREGGRERTMSVGGEGGVGFGPGRGRARTRSVGEKEEGQKQAEKKKEGVKEGEGKEERGGGMHSLFWRGALISSFFSLKERFGKEREKTRKEKKEKENGKGKEKEPEKVKTKKEREKKRTKEGEEEGGMFSGGEVWDFLKSFLNGLEGDFSFRAAEQFLNGFFFQFFLIN